jgi:hypothetical protein
MTNPILNAILDKHGGYQVNDLSKHRPPTTFGQTLSILVVDDDKAVAGLIQTILNDVEGWGATVVHDAAAARAVFRHIRVEALVLDVTTHVRATR